MQADPRHLLPGRRRGHLRARRVVAQEVPVHGGAEMTEDGALAAGRHRRRPATLLRQHRAADGETPRWTRRRRPLCARCCTARGPSSCASDTTPHRPRASSATARAGVCDLVHECDEDRSTPPRPQPSPPGGGGARAATIWPPEEWRRSSGRSAGRGAPAPSHRQRGQGELQCRGRGRCRRGAPCGARGWGSRARTPHSPTLSRPGFTDAPQPRRLAVSPEEVVRVALEAVAPVRRPGIERSESVAARASGRPSAPSNAEIRFTPQAVLPFGRRTTTRQDSSPEPTGNPAARSGPTLPR